MALAVVAPVLIAWGAWSLMGRVTVYEVTEQARLETSSAAHPVAALVGGRVAETHLAIGREVRRGDVLVVIDSEAERLALREHQVRRDGLLARLEALRREIEVEHEGLAARHESLADAVEEARARSAEAVARIGLARQQGEVEAGHAAARAADRATRRVALDRTVEELDRRAHLAKLEGDAVALRGDVANEEATIRRLEHDLVLRTVRAPVSGRVGEVSDGFRVGSVLRPAERLGAIVPPGAPRAVALFPASAVGRLRPGQPARLRLEGYAWTQYGTIPATVADAANEPSGGRIRVELTLTAGVPTRIPLGHGLPGSAEVAIERVSPAVLVLRAAGQAMAIRRVSARRGDARGHP